MLQAGDVSGQRLVLKTGKKYGRREKQWGWSAVDGMVDMHLTHVGGRQEPTEIRGDLAR